MIIKGTIFLVFKAKPVRMRISKRCPTMTGNVSNYKGNSYFLRWAGWGQWMVPIWIFCVSRLKF